MRQFSSVAAEKGKSCGAVQNKEEEEEEEDAKTSKW